MKHPSLTTAVVALSLLAGCTARPHSAVVDRDPRNDRRAVPHVRAGGPELGQDRGANPDNKPQR